MGAASTGAVSSASGSAAGVGCWIFGCAVARRGGLESVRSAGADADAIACGDAAGVACAAYPASS
jgi:hypothetical protein